MIGLKETMMRWILLFVAVLVLLPFIWHLLALITGVAFGLIHFVVLLAIVIFLVGLVRRLMLIR
jgi:hypothetical protein